MSLQRESGRHIPTPLHIFPEQLATWFTWLQRHEWGREVHHPPPAGMFVEFVRMSAIRVIQFTDPHLFGDLAGTLRGVNSYQTLERTLADAAGHLAIADAILVTGDLVQDDAGGYQHFRRAFARFGKPVLCIPGNHDLVPEMRAALAGPPFDIDGPADIGAWRIVLLDSVVPNQAGGHISIEQLTKLDEELAGAQRHAMVCLIIIP